VRALATVALAAFCAAAWAQRIATDATLGRPGLTLTGPAYAIPATLGELRGANLFHSFQTFGLVQGESATFSGPSSVAHVIGRVTGGAASSIDGTLRSSIPGASLWLFNPAGMAFGPNARLDVQGSFHASSAHFLSLGDGSVFHATNPGASVLTSAAPSAFGFIDATRAPLAVNGSFLQVPDGRTLSLTGGDLTVTSSTLAALAGRLELTGDAMRIDASLVTAEGRDSGASAPGTIAIRGGTLTLANGAWIRSLNWSPTSGGGIDVDLTGALSLESGSAISTRTFGAGPGGELVVRAGGMHITGGAFMDSYTPSPGAGGRLVITSSAPILISGESASGASGLYSVSTAAGASGAISIVAPSVTIDAEAAILSSTVGSGPSGKIRIEGGSLRVAGGAFVGGTSTDAGSGGDIEVSAARIDLDGGDIQSFALDAGNSGTVRLATHELVISNGGGITTDSSGSGRTGDVHVVATGSVRISSPNAFNGITADASGSGSAGSIYVTTPELVITRGRISSDTSGSGNAGDIHLDVGRAMLDRPFIESNSIVPVGAAGNAGNIFLRATESIDLAGGTLIGGISTSNVGDGRAGSIVIQAPVLRMTGGLIQSNNQLGQEAGTIDISVGRLEISGTAAIQANNFISTGGGGSIRVTASESISISPGSSLVDYGAITSLSSSRAGAGSIVITTPRLTLAGRRISSETIGSGAGGEIRIDAGTVDLGAGARIDSSSVGTATGDAGSIVIDATDRLVLHDGAVISTEAVNARGGNISIRATNLLRLTGSSITTSVGAGTGDGGNITIDPVFVLLENGSRIIARAVGGNGGNIGIISEFFMQSDDSVVDASSQRGISGSVTVNAPPVDFGSSLRLPTPSFLDASSLLRASCGARAGASNSFFAAGRGGVADSPAEPVASPTRQAVASSCQK
jgi:filamentous hemagglutinin family protein